ncbi:MBL fold metallo-hydrolase [Proteinivorax hydrogeniformans]|uniref:MBL fold metallo-hydrolase n=1 Tax=Proteinivorax hydrogeniformans TaxID=1826727 RepID=A0AAU8HRR2_9FIRM
MKFKDSGQGCTVQYLFNSGFAVETQSNILIFDYCKRSEYITDKLLSGKKVTVFVTHDHSDHFNSIIYEWSKKHDVCYVIDENVDKSPNANIYTVKPDEHLFVNDISIKTLGSTDRGVSFLVKVDDVTIFHSGDLNWWKWKNDSIQTQRQEELDYKNEIHKLLNQHIDIAFIPVDPRLGEFYDLAAKYFAEVISVSNIIPMHFTTSPKSVEIIAEKWQLRPKFVPLLLEGQTATFKLQGRSHPPCS